MTSDWSKPVQVYARADATIRFLVSDPVKAAEILLKHWPRRAAIGPTHLQAGEKLLQCLKCSCDARNPRKRSWRPQVVYSEDSSSSLFRRHLKAKTLVC